MAWAKVFARGVDHCRSEFAEAEVDDHRDAHLLLWHPMDLGTKRPFRAAVRSRFRGWVLMSTLYRRSMTSAHSEPKSSNRNAEVNEAMTITLSSGMPLSATLWFEYQSYFSLWYLAHSGLYVT